MKQGFVIVALLLGCTSSDNCEIESPELIYYDSYNGFNIHHVLLDGIEDSCIDSATIINIAKTYITNVVEGTPVSDISFYSSKSGFIEGKSQNISDINKDCIVGISFNDKMEPVKFAFYNDEGIMIHWGERWLK